MLIFLEEKVRNLLKQSDKTFSFTTENLNHEKY